MTPDFSRVKALSFDCYGTLIDWESGILAALRSIVPPGLGAVSDDQLLGRYAEYESGAQAGEFRTYREVLGEVTSRFAQEFEVELTTTSVLADSIERWPAFPDSAEALAALGSRFKLAVLSNIDDDLFAGTLRKLDARLDEVVTAEQVHSYKPAPKHFHAALSRLQLEPGELVHVAQSLYHDIRPANELGLATVWVNRQAGRSGATPTAQANPDLEVPDLATLVQVIERAE